jgi:hypothetical protein
MRCSDSPHEYLKFVRKILKHREQVHEDVELVLLESLLRVEARGRRAHALARLALEMIKEISESRRNSVFAAPACLLVLRFGGRPSKTQLRSYFREKAKIRYPQLIRASAITYATHGGKEFTEVRKAAASLLNNPLALMVRIIEKLKELKGVPDRFKSRLNLRRDSVRGRQYLDMRTYVAGRLLTLNRRKAIRAWLNQWAQTARQKNISAFDKRLLAKLIV